MNFTEKNKIKCLVFVLLVCFITENVFGQQVEPRIINPVSNQQMNCNCVLVGYCTGIIVNPGTGTVDLRIVNPSSKGTNLCQVGYVNCCTNNPQPAIDSMCGKRKLPSTAKRGGEASNGSYPWHVAIFTQNPENYIGAGVIISDSVILTVAHKVFALAGLSILSSKNPSEYLQLLPAITTIHPNFNQHLFNNDIAIIRVGVKIPFDKYPNINTACLPTQPPAAGTRCWTAGWGVNGYANGQLQNLLREVELPIVASDLCEKQLRATRLGPNFRMDRNTFMCAGAELERDTCTNDGGGALVCPQPSGQFQVVGLTAWGIGCGQANVPGSYVNVYNYLSWIKNNL